MRRPREIFVQTRMSRIRAGDEVTLQMLRRSIEMIASAELAAPVPHRSDPTRKIGRKIGPTAGLKTGLAPITPETGNVPAKAAFSSA